MLANATVAAGYMAETTEISDSKPSLLAAR